MALTLAPTKGNLMASKHSLELARLGYDLMDRKRNVLIHEMMGLMEDVRLLKADITKAYQEAYYALQQANVSLGMIQDIAASVPIDTELQVVYRSVMGVEIPKLIYQPKPITLEYSLERSNARLDSAYVLLQRVKQLTIHAAEIDNSVFRLAKAIQKTQKRANALQHIVIPDLLEQISTISSALEEKEREEFTRLKVLKQQHQQ